MPVVAIAVQQKDGANLILQSSVSANSVVVGADPLIQALKCVRPTGLGALR